MIQIGKNMMKTLILQSNIIRRANNISKTIFSRIQTKNSICQSKFLKTYNFPLPSFGILSSKIIENHGKIMKNMPNIFVSIFENLQNCTMNSTWSWKKNTISAQLPNLLKPASAKMAQITHPKNPISVTNRAINKNIGCRSGPSS